jgi:hypothetical protein
MNIPISPEIESALVAAAQRQGTTPEALALSYLRERFAPAAPAQPPAEGPTSLADFLAGHVGILASSEHVPGGAHMSEEPGRKLADGLLRRLRQ